MFLVGVPILVVAFVLTWFLKEMPLHETAGLLQGVDESFGLQDVGLAEICEELEVRKRAAEAAVRRLDALSRETNLPADSVAWLRQQYQQRIDQLTECQQLLSQSRGRAVARAASGGPGAVAEGVDRAGTAGRAR